MECLVNAINQVMHPTNNGVGLNPDELIMKQSFLSCLLVLLGTILGFSNSTVASVQFKTQEVAQNEYSTKKLYNLWLSSTQDSASIPDFMLSLPEQHIIESIKNDNKNVMVTYFSLGSVETDYFMLSGGPDFYGLRFKQLGNTNLYFCTQKIPNDAMFIYGINEFKFSGKGLEQGVVKTSMEHVYDGAVIAPNAKLSPYVKAISSVLAGKLIDVNLSSKYMNENRKVSLYLPANYQVDLHHNLVILFDGRNYSATADAGELWKGWTPTPTILDNLIAEKEIEPTIALMVWNQGNRSDDLINDNMADFIALELIPWARRLYKIHPNPAKVIVSGSSRGGFAAANAALKYSNLIGGVLSQSGSFYYTMQEEQNWPIYPEFEGKLIIDYKKSPKLPIRFYLSVGLYDLGIGRVGANRQLKDILELKGYDVEHREYNGGHSHVNWRHDLSKGLIYLLGK